MGKRTTVAGPGRDAAVAAGAPARVPGFTPPIFGEVKIANFWVTSYPAGGSFALAAWAAPVASLTIRLIV